ncbi:MAG: sensor histidine kinase, partial [Micromonosporaceae bacterium]
VRLDELLAAVATRTPDGLRVQPVLVPCQVPTAVADALAHSSGEALTNSARHAGVDTAVLSLTTVLGRVRVEISDNGCGFDPDQALAHRYGVRQSIVGRMAAVGGRARVESAPGVGTRWTLEWPAPVNPP